MSYTTGRCTNTEHCGVAAAGRDVPVVIGVPFVCPGCGAPLSAPPARGMSATTRMVLLGSVLAIVAGGGVVAFALLRTGAATANAAGTPGPVAAAHTDAPIAAAAAVPPAASPAPPAPVKVASIVAPPAAAPAPAPVAVTTLLKLDGASAMQSRLGPSLAAAYLDSLGDTDIATTPEPAKHRIIVSGLRGEMREAIEVDSHSATFGFQSLLRDDADIAMSTRRIKPVERQEGLSLVGDLTSPASEHVIGLDGIAVIVNPANRVTTLSVDQLRGIFSGQIQNWSQLGGAPGPIAVWSRNIDSGTYDSFAESVLGNAALGGGVKQSDNEADMAAAVAADPNAIAFLSQAHVGTARPVAIATVGGAPSLPTQTTIQTEDYPFTHRLYLYTASAPKNPFVSRFADFVQSDAGQAVVEKAGFVSLRVRTAQVAAPVVGSSKYRQLVDSAYRVSVDFRFQAGLDDLDNRAARDLDRVIEFLKQSHLPSSRLVLVGFADNKGAPAFNLAISKKRAEAVAAMLARRGMAPGKVEAFGSDAPVADNSTPAGRELNRRVEVYIAPG
jgi:phosphate transport system substrate-binding protein